ncbi:MAG: hypothetical protein AAGC72_02785 [Planctomycetota bacterium]
MAAEQSRIRTFVLRLVGCLLAGLTGLASADKSPEPELNTTGEELRQGYAQMLETLSAEIVAALPNLDSQKKEAFEKARAAVSALDKPGGDAPPQAFAAYESAKAQAETDSLAATRAMLADIKPFLASDALDGKLIRIAILRHGTPAGLAEFAQESDTHKAMLDKLFADDDLMKLMLISGGANGGEYGEAMEVYTAILEASEKARERGTIFHNLALGTALHQPWLNSSARETDGSINAAVFTDHSTPEGQIERYLHYEKAYLEKELDPAFKDFNAWECRYITNDPYTNTELAWGREMLRNFRPDHRTNDKGWRYVGLVKSDLPYCSTRHDDSLGLPKQQALALGGICGRRAFFGRFITRAHGIPARRSTQTGHAAMNMWTPDGWVTRLGAWWSMNWCGPWGGMDFYLDAQAREFEKDYRQVLRAQWIGDALGQEDVSIRQYGKGGGFWDGLAHFMKRAIVEEANFEKAAAEAELASLTAEEARLLGESDRIIGAPEVKEVEIPEKYKAVVTDKNGSITVPAIAITSPKNNTDKVAFLKSWDEGMQIHYQRAGNRPEILRYSVEAPKAGKYEVRALVSTVSPEGLELIYRINRRTLVETGLPYTKGMWEMSKPETIELREGRNSIMLTFRAPNRGVSLKEIRFTPAE